MAKKKKLKNDPNYTKESDLNRDIDKENQSLNDKEGMSATGMFLMIFTIVLAFAGLYLGYLWKTGKIQIGSIDYSMFSSSTSTPSPTETPTPTPEKTYHEVPLDKLILDYLDEEGLDKDRISFMIEDFEDDVIYKYKEKEYFTAASTYKLPLTMIWMDKVNAGEANLDDLMTYKYSMYEEGGPIGADYAPGEKIDLETVIRFTIQYSDNSGGHILFEALGGWEEYKEIAARYCPVVQDDEFFSMENVYNAEYMNYLLRKLYQNQDDYALIIQAMKDSKPTQWLNQVIHDITYQKYGEVEYFGHAVGFVKDGHPYSIAVYTEYGGDAPQIIGEINAICYEYFNGHLPEDLIVEAEPIEDKPVEKEPVEEEITEEVIEEETTEEG